MGMALMGTCVALLLSLLANHIYLARRLMERNNKVSHAMNKTEEACLGILGGKFEEVADKKRIWRGRVNAGLSWKVVEKISKEDGETFLYDVTLADVHFQGVRIQKHNASLLQER